MKLSQMKVEDLPSLTVEEIAKIVFGGTYKEPTHADVALLLGTRPGWSEERALQAAKLYREGKVDYIMPSGGVEWETPSGETMSEAYYMAKILKENGVSEEAILIENEATTTKENMIYGVLQMNRQLKIRNVRTVCIVTSANHMRRSEGLAKLFLPRSVEISYSVSNPPKDPVAFLLEKNHEKIARHGVALMKGLIDDGLIDDIEY